jgi:hypothetical protein
MTKLVEEISDVLLYLDVLGVELVDVAGTIDSKLTRWAARLEDQHHES